MLENHTPPKTLPANVRVMIALVASPTLLVVGMMFYTLFVNGWRAVSVSMMVFSLLSLFAYYIVITGHLPRIKLKNHK